MDAIAYIIMFIIFFGFLIYTRDNAPDDDYSHQLMSSTLQSYFEIIKKNLNLTGDIIILNQVLHLEGTYRGYRISIDRESKDTNAPIIITVLFSQDLTKNMPVFHFPQIKNLKLNFLLKSIDAVEKYSESGLTTILHKTELWHHYQKIRKLKGKSTMFSYKVISKISQDQINSDSQISSIINETINEAQIIEKAMYDETFILELIESEKYQDQWKELIYCFGEHGRTDNKAEILKRIRRKKDLRLKLAANRYMYNDRKKYINTWFKKFDTCNENEKKLILEEISFLNMTDHTDTLKDIFIKSKSISLKEAVLMTLSHLDNNLLWDFLTKEIFLKRNSNESLQIFLIGLMTQNIAWDTAEILKKIYRETESPAISKAVEAALNALNEEYPSKKGQLSISIEDELDGAISETESDGKLSI